MRNVVKQGHLRSSQRFPRGVNHREVAVPSIDMIGDTWLAAATKFCSVCHHPFMAPGPANPQTPQHFDQIVNGSDQLVAQPDSQRENVEADQEFQA